MASQYNQEKYSLPVERFFPASVTRTETEKEGLGNHNSDLASDWLHLRDEPATNNQYTSGLYLVCTIVLLIAISFYSRPVTNTTDNKYYIIVLASSVFTFLIIPLYFMIQHNVYKRKAQEIKFERQKVGSDLAKVEASLRDYAHKRDGMITLEVLQRQHEAKAEATRENDIPLMAPTLAQQYDALLESMEEQQSKT